LGTELCEAMDIVSLNDNLFIDGQSLCFFLLLLQQVVNVCLNWEVGITHKFLLFSVFPCFEVANFNFVEVNAEGKIINVIYWDLAILPSLKILLICS
jgi:hypothetical protein